MLPDADIHVMACASASWRDALSRDIRSMSFTWAARDPRNGHLCAVRACSIAVTCSCFDQSAACSILPLAICAHNFLLTYLFAGMLSFQLSKMEASA